MANLESTAKVIAESLMARVAIDPETNCWNWKQSTGRKGYGQMGFNGETGRRAHRVFYEYFKGPIPAGLVLDHLCSNRRCVNPSHLDPVTQRENLRRAGLTLESTCKHGHAMTPENVEIRKRDNRTFRNCRECSRIRLRELKRRKRLSKAR